MEHNRSYYSFRNNNVLEITVLNRKELIPKYDGGDNISCDYVTVECEVLDNASGILTNVAEIAIYKTEQGSVSEDRDSKPDNWRNPVNGVHSDNKTVDKKFDMLCSSSTIRTVFFIFLTLQRQVESKNCSACTFIRCAH